MNAMEIGTQLVSLCREGKNLEAIEKLYAKDCHSVEARAMGGQPAEMHGLDAILGKSKDWRANNEVHSASAEGPYPHGDRFAVHFKYDVTNKQMNARFQMDEIALYTVKDGKIAHEEFFYTGM